LILEVQIFGPRAELLAAAGLALPEGPLAVVESSVRVELNRAPSFSATLVTAGINLSATGNSVWTITNNKLFQTGTRVYTTGNTHSGIFIGTGLQFEIERPAKPFAERQTPSTIDPRAPGSVDDQLHASRFIEEALEQDAMERGHETDCGHLGRRVAYCLRGGMLADAGVGLQPGDGR
jgi:hypothetical protein